MTTAPRLQPPRLKQLRLAGLVAFVLFGLALTALAAQVRKHSLRLMALREFTSIGPTDPNFTVLMKVEDLTFLFPNRVLAFPWPKDAAAKEYMPCPKQTTVRRPSACIRHTGTGVTLRLPIPGEPGIPSSKAIVSTVTLLYLPEAGSFQLTPQSFIASNTHRDWVTSRVPELDIPSYLAFRLLLKPEAAKISGQNLTASFENSFTLVSTTGNIPAAINCDFVSGRARDVSHSVCEAAYPFSSDGASWPPHPLYQIRYGFPGSDIASAARIALSLESEIRHFFWPDAK